MQTPERTHRHATARRWFGLLACLCLLLQQFAVPVHLALEAHAGSCDSPVGQDLHAVHGSAHRHSSEGYGSEVHGHAHPAVPSATGQHAEAEGGLPTPPSHPAEDHHQDHADALARLVPAVPAVPALPMDGQTLLPLICVSRLQAGADRTAPDRPPPDATAAPRAPPAAA